MLRGLAIDITVTSHTYQVEPPDNIGSLPAFFEKIEGEDSQEVLRGYRYDPNAGGFLDYWGNPIKLVVKSRHNYRFISAGQNGKHEGGLGDDIVYEFDPWEFREPKETKQQ